MPQEKKNRQGGGKSKNPNGSRFTGIWTTRSKPHLVYKVVPKAGCSSIGQIMNFIDTGSFIDGTVHNSPSSVMKWADASQRGEMIRILIEETPYWFTLVRNPYTRLFSAFTDKIFGYQENGGRYRSGNIHKHLQTMGLKWGPGSNIIENFKIFLSFVASNIEQRIPFPPDIHWAPQYRALKVNAKWNPEFCFNYVGHIETFRSDINMVLEGAGIDPNILPSNTPRENSTPIVKISIEEFFGVEEIAIMRRIYSADFEYLGYSDHPSSLKPVGKIDLRALNASFHF